MMRPLFFPAAARIADGHRRMLRRARSLSALVVLAIFSSCAGDGFRSVQYESVDEASWGAFEPLSFTLGPVPSAGPYDLRLLLRMSSTHPYPFKTLFVEVQQEWGADSVVRIDTVECHFAHTVWETEGIHLHQYDYAVSSRHCHPADSVRISLRHLMRKEEIPGVSNVGIALQPSAE